MNKLLVAGLVAAVVALGVYLSYSLHEKPRVDAEIAWLQDADCPGGWPLLR